MSAMNSIENTIREVAVAAARVAGEKQKEHFGKATVIERVYAHDIKLEVDRISEAAIVEMVQSEFPDHLILAEESGQIGDGCEYVWFIDPLDGTMNFSSGLQYFCTCIACYKIDPHGENPSAAGVKAPINGKKPRTQESLGNPIVGVIYAPMLNELFVGVAGHGATLNGNPVTIRPGVALEDAIVAFSLGSEEKTISRMERIVSSLVRNCRKLRLLGACGLDIANIAAGRLDALIQRRVRCWDFAASRIILEEAGGIVDAVEFSPGRWDVLACAPVLQDTFLSILADRS
jgi:fructose-1,6-bisphosphatase/inositol monophosphatase family enzyme